jgi:hypothetical protein
MTRTALGEVAAVEHRRATLESEKEILVHQPLVVDSGSIPEAFGSQRRKAGTIVSAGISKLLRRMCNFLSLFPLFD